MRHAANAILLSLCLAASALAGIGDTVRVTLKRGDPVVGTLVSQDAREIVVETIISNIPYKRTLRQSEIRSIEVVEAPAPKTTIDRNRDAEDDEPDDKRDAGSKAYTYYVTIPVEARIGFSSVSDPPGTVTREGVEAALQYARRRGIEHVVFTFDSSGGDLDEALSIVEIISDMQSEFTTHAVIEHCSGAAVPIALACEHVWFEVAGFLSGPGPDDETPDASTINRCSVIASELGWSGEAFEKVMRGELANITARDCESHGLGKAINGDESEIDEELKLENWRSLGKHGEKQLSNVNESILRKERIRRKDVEGIIGAIDDALATFTAIDNSTTEAERIDPNRFNDYSYYRYTGDLTPTAQKRWRQRTDAAVDHWQRAVTLIDSVVKKKNAAEKQREQFVREEPHPAFAGHKAEELGRIEAAFEELEQFGVQLQNIRDNAVRKIQTLQKERNRHKV